MFVSIERVVYAVNAYRNGQLIYKIYTQPTAQLNTDSTSITIKITQAMEERTNVIDPFQVARGRPRVDMLYYRGIQLSRYYMI